MRCELPYLAPWYRVAAGESQIVLEYGQRVVALQGGAVRTLLPALLPLLDGTRTVDEIVAVLGEPARPAVEQALERLDAHGLLLEGPPSPDDEPSPQRETIAVLTALQAGRRRVADTAASLRSGSVSVVGDGGAAIEIGRLLRLSGVDVDRRTSIREDASLTVCAPAPEQLPRLSAWNQEALETGARWLQVLPFDGRYAAVGPLYLPGDTCCYECFRLRRAANLETGDELRLLEQTPASYPAAPVLTSLVAALAALLVLEWLVLESHYVPAAFYALGLLPVITLAVHHVHRVPRCPACSTVAGVSPPLPWHKEVPLAGR